MLSKNLVRCIKTNIRSNLLKLTTVCFIQLACSEGAKADR